MNSGNSKTFDSHRLFLNLTDNIDLKRSNKYVALSNLSIYYTWKNIKNMEKNMEKRLIILQQEYTFNTISNFQLKKQ